MFGCEQAEQLVQSDTSATASLEYTFYWQRSLILNTVCNHLSRFMGCTRHACSVESRSGRCVNKCLPGPNPLLRVLADETHRSQSLFQIYRMHLSNLFPRVAFRAVALPRGGKWLRRTRGRLSVVATSGTTSAIRCLAWLWSRVQHPPPSDCEAESPAMQIIRSAAQPGSSNFI